jgi:hypothetical protein
MIFLLLIMTQIDRFCYWIRWGSENSMKRETNPVTVPHYPYFTHVQPVSDEVKMKIRSSIDRLFGHPILKGSFLLGLTCFLLPFLLYFLEQRLGIILSYDEWSTGIYGNQGPWKYRLEGLLIVSPYLCLIPVTLSTSLLLSISERRPLLMLQGLAITASFMAMAVVQFYYLSWIID